MPDSTLTVHYQQRFGAFDRIASLLRRRGFPIAGITVERTHVPDVGRITVAVQGNTVAEQVRRHLAKLADVIDVQINIEGAVQREYVLMRVHCEPAHDGEIGSILDRHGARTVAHASDALVIEASGTGVTIDALFADLAPFGIEESARTNPIALSHTADGATQQSA